MYNLVITEKAASHILAAATYYEGQLPGLSERFLAELNSAYSKIGENPQHYSYIFKNKKYRDVKLSKFPYVVIFEIDKKNVIVLAVLNTRQETKF
jgi:plasmid stabilization system protein ParE